MKAQKCKRKVVIKTVKKERHYAITTTLPWWFYFLSKGAIKVLKVTSGGLLMTAIISDRNMEIYNLRENQKMIFKDIASQYNISTGHARDIYLEVINLLEYQERAKDPSNLEFYDLHIHICQYLKRKFNVCSVDNFLAWYKETYRPELVFVRWRKPIKEVARKISEKLSLERTDSL